MHSNLSGPTKVVCYREVFTIGGVCYEWFHRMYSRKGQLRQTRLCVCAYFPLSELGNSYGVCVCVCVFHFRK